MIFKEKVIAGLLLSSFVVPAGAATITYDTFTNIGSDPINYEVVINDDTAGQFNISYKVISTLTVGKLTGIFFDFGPVNTSTLPDPDTSDPYTAANLGLANEFNPSGTSSCAQAFGDVKSVSGSQGCNSTIQLGTTIIDGFDYAGFLFDVGLAWKVNDLTSGQTGGFSISDLGGLLSLDDWGAIGLRGQDTSGTGGSAKEFQLIGVKTGGDEGNVPEPTALLLIATGLLGLFGATRKKA